VAEISIAVKTDARESVLIVLRVARGVHEILAAGRIILYNQRIRPEGMKPVTHAQVQEWHVFGVVLIQKIGIALFKGTCCLGFLLE
jgi:hypothetical protein